MAKNKRWIALGLGILLLITGIITGTLAAQKVELSIIPTPDIDIVLTKSRTRVDLSNFAEDIKNRLQSKGINKDRVHVSAIEAQDANLLEAFDWNRDVSSSIGSIAITNNGQNVVMYGNPQRPGKNAIWFTPEGNYDEEINFNYNINFGDSFNAAGLLLRVEQTGNVLTGYMLSFNNGAWRSQAGGTNGAIWEFTYTLGTNYANFTKTLKQSLNIAYSGSLTVKVTSGNITVSGSGIPTPVSYDTEKEFGTGFGFFADHYSHDCNLIGAFSLSNIKLTLYSVKDFTEVLRGPTWREDSLRVVVNVDDYVNEQFDNPTSLSEITTRMMNDNLHFVPWGTSANQPQLEKMIKTNDNKGKFIANSDYDAAIDTTAQYIRDLLGAYEPTNYLILGENSTITINPEELKDHTTDEKYPNGRWRVEHEYEYFENNIGQYSKTGRYMDSAISEFDKVGKYNVYFEDEQIKEVYVHRRPVAAFTIGRNGNNVNLTSTSYDLDKMSTNKGISEEQWSYKEINDEEWTVGKLSRVEPGKTYIVQLKVKDYQDTWSNAENKFLTTEASNPIASFNIVNPDVTIYENLQVQDTSYDPGGLEITGHKWEVKKGNEVIYTGDTLPTNYLASGVGTYTITLIVANSDGRESEAYSKVFDLKNDTIAPELLAQKRNATVINEKIPVEVSFTDRGGSGFKSYRYAITDSTDTPTQWSEPIEKDKDTITVTEEGISYIHVIAVDHAGNESEDIILGAYHNNPVKYQIQIDKVRQGDSSIKLTGVEFEVQQPDYQDGSKREVVQGTTDSNGNLNVKVRALGAGTYTYTLVETKTLEGYKNAEPVSLQITFNEAGEIINASVIGENTTLQETTANGVKLMIGNEKQEPEQSQSYTLYLEGIDKTNAQKKLAGIQYQVEIDYSSGEKQILQGTTGEDGRIQLNNLAGDGEIQIKIIQTQTISGYKINKEETVLTINRNAQTGEMIGIGDKSSQGIEATLYPNSKEILVLLRNEAKQEENEMQLHIKDTQDNAIGISGITYELVLPYSLPSVQATTNENGILTFGNIQNLGEGDHLYTLKKKTATDEYQLADEIKLSIRFDASGKITKVEEITSNISSIEMKKAETEENIYIQAILTMNIQKDVNMKQERIKVIKTDANNPNQKLAGVIYKVTVKTENTIQTTQKTTDNFGEIVFEVPQKDSVEVMIKEIKSISGYVLNSQEVKLVLKQNALTGKMYVDKAESTQGIQIEEDVNNNTISLYQTNTKKVQQTGKGKANICFFLEKKDKNGVLLGNVELEITEKKTGAIYHVKTDAFGKVEIHDFQVPEEGAYEFTIQEKQTVEGYEKEDTSIKLGITYEEYEGTMKTSSIIIKRGYKWIEYQQCNEYETDENYQLDVIMTLINNAVPGEEKETLSIHKVGNMGEKLARTSFEINVIYENGGMLKLAATTDNIGEIIRNLTIPEGKTKIELIETKVPQGYQKAEKQTIALEKKQGILSINRAQTSSSLKEVNIINNKVIQVTFENQKIEGGNIQDSDGSISSIVRDSYALEIIKQNKYNHDLRMQGAVFNVQLEKEGNTVLNKNYSINVSDSKAIVKNLLQTGDITIRIQEVVAGLHHKLNEEKYTIAIHRDPNTKEIIVDNAKTTQGLSVQIDNIHHKIIVRIDNEPAELMLGIRKVDKQDENIQLANAGFSIGKYSDYSQADLETFGYILTDQTGTGYTVLNTYATSSTTLYAVTEQHVPTGYQGNMPIGLYITTDKNGDITKAWIKEDSDLFAKGVCEVEEIHGNYVGLKIKDERQPLPTYSVKIQKENEYNRTTKVPGAVFNVQITQEQGTNVNTNIKTGQDGIAAVKGLNGTGEIKIELEEIQTATGYKLETGKKTIVVNREVKTTVDQNGQVHEEKITLNQDKTDKGLELSVNNRTKEIILKLTNEPQFSLGIEKVDLQDAGVKLPGAEFKLTSTEGNEANLVTDSSGKAYAALGKTVSNKTIIYTLKETKAPSGYDLLKEEIKIEVTFDSSGQVIKSEVIQGDKANIQIAKNHYIELLINNGESSSGGSGGQGESSFKFQLIKENIKNLNLKIPKVTFDISIQSEDGISKKAIKSTNDAGEIQISGIKGYGKIQIKIKEIEAGQGYVTDGQEKIITLKREKGTDKLSIVTEETSKELRVQIDNDQKLVQANISNNISQDSILMAFVKEDEEDELVTLPKAVYEIKEEQTQTVYQTTTNSKGIGSIVLPLQEEGTYVYKIKEIKAPEGYQLNEQEIELQVVYNAEGKIQKAQILTGQETGRIENQWENYLEVHLKDKPEEKTIEEYDIKVIKVDRDDIDITLPGAELQIDVANEIGPQLTKTDITDADGQIGLQNIKGTGKIQVDITEITPPPGRRFDSKQKKVVIQRNPETGRLKLEESLNVDTIIDNKQKLITILVRNEQAEGLYTIALVKKDKQNPDNCLTGAEYRLKVPGAKEEITVTVNEEGKAILSGLEIPVAGTYQYKLKETKAPKGYQLDPEEKTIEITFGKEKGEIVITKVKIKKGNNITVSNQANQYVCLDLFNQKDITEHGEYELTIHKVDKEKPEIGVGGVEFGIKIKAQSGEEIYTKATTDKDGNIVLKGLKGTGAIEVKLEEKKVPEGYELDGAIKTVQYTRNPATKEISIGNIQGENITAKGKDDNKNVEIQISNDISDTYFDLHLEKFINKINETEYPDNETKVIVEEGRKIRYEKGTGVGNIHYGDRIIYTLRVYNEGYEDGYAKELIDEIPEGLAFRQGDAINQKYEWKLDETGKIAKTNYLSKEKSEDNKIGKFDYPNMATPEYKEVKIAFQVEAQKGITQIQNIGKIGEQTDDKGDDKEEEGRFEENDNDKEEVTVEYVDLKLNKYISRIQEINNKTQKATDLNVDVEASKRGNLLKVEMRAKEIKNILLKIEYKIEIRNEGNKAGKIEDIYDKLPEGMTYKAEENAGWEQTEQMIRNSNLTGTILQPGESKEVTMVVEWNGAKQATGIKTNTAVVACKEDIDTIAGQEANATNNADTAVVILGTSTGEAVKYVVLTGSVLGMLGIGIYLIKKFAI